MRPWNVVVTARPAPGAVHKLLAGLRVHGSFHATPFKYVCVGLVEEERAFLDALLEAQRSGTEWTAHLARAVPISATFEFTADSLLDELKAAVADKVPDAPEATFFVRVERRGMAGKMHSTDIELALADHLSSMAAARGCTLKTAFDDPDFIFAVETLESQGGLSVVTREMRHRYPFVRIR